MDVYFSQSRHLWTPPQPQSAASEVLRRYINKKHGLQLSACSSMVRISAFAPILLTITVSIEDYHDLHKYSVEDYTFWLDLWEYLGIISSTPPDKV